MLNIYYHKDLEIGYDFYDFRAQEYGCYFTKFEFESQLENELKGIKLDLLRFNVEDFVFRFSEADIMRNELQNTALNRMFDFVKWSWGDNVTPAQVYKNLAKMEQFIITIVNAYKGLERQRAIKEWRFIMDFLTKELK